MSPLEAGILFPFTQLKDDFGGEAGIWLPSRLSQTFMIKCTLSPLVLFLPTEKDICFSKAKHFYFWGLSITEQCFLLNVNHRHLSSGLEVECMFPLCTARR